MSDAAGEFAVIELKNTTESPLDVQVTIGGRTHAIATLPPGGTTRQLTPTGASWSVSPSPAAPGEPDGSEPEAPDGGPKGGTSTFE